MKFHISFFLILYIVFFKNTIKCEGTGDVNEESLSAQSPDAKLRGQNEHQEQSQQSSGPSLEQPSQQVQPQESQLEVGTGRVATSEEKGPGATEPSPGEELATGRTPSVGGESAERGVSTQGATSEAGGASPTGEVLTQTNLSTSEGSSSPSSTSGATAQVPSGQDAISNPSPQQKADTAEKLATQKDSPKPVLPPAHSFKNLNQSNISQTIPVKSYFLKHYKGVKVTGSCGVQFQLVIVPHLFINVETKTNNIQLEPQFMKLSERIDFEKDKANLKNKCEDNKNKSFKFILYLQDDMITIKWKVDEEKTATTTTTPPGKVDLNVDVKRYKLPKLDQPVTSIQIHSLAKDGEKYLMESKDYDLGDKIPEKCEAIANDCFLSGNVDIEKCFQCTLLVNKADKNDECLKYVSKNIKDRFEEIATKGEDDEDSDEYEFIASANYILKNMYKKNDTNEKKELLDFKEVDNDLKVELLNYCNLLKDNDVNGILTNEELGNEQDIFNNLSKLLEEHKEENDNVLYHKMKNEALCLKNVNDWMKNKTGLVLPQLKYSLNNVNENNENYIKENVFEEDENGIVDLTKFTVDTNYSSYNHADSLYCNQDYCNRLKDHNNCVSKINVEDQKNCALSWAFASKYHLETIKCMKGYEPVNTSALYVANCGKNENKNVCTEGSNPLVFLQTVEEKGFLPTESNYPYDESKVGDACPEVQNEWDNAFENTKVLDYNNEPFSLGTKGYTAYESEHFKDNMDTFVKLIKDEIKNKGSVIAYVKAENVLGYELNGKKVQNLCGDKTPDHAVNIVGYGNYINDEDEKKSYWIVRNSWGKYWGDDGYFKVDMYGPSNCENNFIHSVVVFNVDVPVNEYFDKKENDKFKYYLKNSPDFYHNIYYKNYNLEKHVSPMNTWGKGLHNKLNNHNLVFGQESAVTVEEGQLGTDSARSLRGEASESLETAKGQGSSTSGAGGSSESSHVDTVVNSVVSTDGSLSRSTGEDQNGNADGRLNGSEGGRPNESAGENSSGQSVTQEKSQVGDVSLPASSQEGINTSPSPNVDKNTPGSLPNPTAAHSQPPVEQNDNERGTNAPGSTQTTPVVPTQTADNSKKAQIFHVLKHIKDSKIKMGLVKYENSDNIGADHVCSRTTAVNPEKQEECVKFCDDNWDNCKNKPSPGYCLTQLKKTNECFFCYV
ncbi:serine repeat antigen 2 [Plasmodium sp. gorilla clade G2]|uniref:serine repeat antigen 2 n=1 Tax=Plasmodium sp. gorilla clade G2 TaxID=880535 RepID=UPI000D26B502|nr:serine repeat antigen 2 [Plasmodium sp. gorilla clade G2]SOV20344.1 serine repeat antigen 2 [Plasmodium sp. gorilla clade G2]